MKFTIYNLKFTHKGEPSMLDTEQGEALLQKVTQLFLDTMRQKQLDYYSLDKHGNKKESYIVHPTQTNGFVALMKIGNNTEVKLHDTDFKESRHMSHPNSHVVFDCRQKDWIVAIENNSEAFRSPDVVSKIISDTLNAKLKDFGIALEIRPRKRVSDFWMELDNRYRNGDRITGMYFDLPDPDTHAPMDVTTDMTTWMRVQRQIEQQMGARHGLYLKHVPRQGMLMHQGNTMAEELTALCCRYGGDIIVYYDRGGQYSYNDSVRMVADVAASIVSDFANVHVAVPDQGDVPELELVTWLDKIRENADDNTYAEKITDPRSKRRQKPL